MSSNVDATRARFSAEAAQWDANPGHIKSSQDALAALRREIPELNQNNGETTNGTKSKSE